ncbi:MAG: hypothetical protein GY898_15680 [Proteobacteria bacterium]|nr:hypothetical protein [Pseudomonadota bacterium]
MLGTSNLVGFIPTTNFDAAPAGARVKVGWFKDPDGNTLSITGLVG